MRGFKVGSRKMRILDFDCECRPIAWYGGDFVTKQTTGIAWKLVNAKGPPEVRVIGESDRSSQVLEEEAAMIEAFRLAYDQADAVTGHYVRGFDLRLVNASCMRLGLEPLDEKLSICTKDDLLAATGISKSMENLSAMFEARHQKFPMNTALWGKANMLLPEGIELTRKRVVNDVIEHVELFETLRDRELLGAPKIWSPGASRTTPYHP